MFAARLDRKTRKPVEVKVYAALQNTCMVEEAAKDPAEFNRHVLNVLSFPN
jgi:hypothetical protein